MNSQDKFETIATVISGIMIISLIIFLMCQLAQGQEYTPLHKHPTMVKMLERSNTIRTKRGLSPHKIDPALCKAAQNHANYMADGGQFSHYANRGYVQRAKDAGYKGQVRENIAMGYITIYDAFRGWASSSGHYASIISNTKNAGFGYQRSKDGTAYWVGVYGY